MYKKIGENISKYSPGMLAASQNLAHENSLLQMHVKLLLKEQFKKQQKQLGTKIEYKLTKDSQEKVIEIPRNSNKYQNMINLLDNTPNQPSRFRAINSIEINDNSRVTYSTNS